MILSATDRTARCAAAVAVLMGCRVKMLREDTGGSRSYEPCNDQARPSHRSEPGHRLRSGLDRPNLPISNGHILAPCRCSRRSAAARVRLQLASIAASEPHLSRPTLLAEAGCEFIIQDDRASLPDRPIHRGAVPRPAHRRACGVPVT